MLTWELFSRGLHHHRLGTNNKIKEILAPSAYHKVRYSQVNVIVTRENSDFYTKYTFFYKQSIFDPRPENCLGFSKKSPRKIV